MSDKFSVDEYQCWLLQGIAHVTVRHEYIDVDESPRPIYMRDSFETCADKMKCGVAKQVGQTIDYDWDICPAAKSLRRTGHL